MIYYFRAIAALIVSKQIRDAYYPLVYCSHIHSNFQGILKRRLKAHPVR